MRFGRTYVLGFVEVTRWRSVAVKNFKERFAATEQSIEFLSDKGRLGFRGILNYADLEDEVIVKSGSVFIEAVSCKRS